MRLRSRGRGACSAKVQRRPVAAPKRLGRTFANIAVRQMQNASSRLNLIIQQFPGVRFRAAEYQNRDAHLACTEYPGGSESAVSPESVKLQT